MTATATDEPPPTPPERQPPVGRRFVRAGVALLLLLVATVALWRCTAGAGSTIDDVRESTSPSATDEIVRGTLEGDTTVSGTLRFADPRTIAAGRDGTVTALPSPAATIGRGDELYAIDAVSTFLLVGPLPAWRDFVSGMADGPDVEQLEENLQELGYFTEEPDEKFRWSTSAAIKAWQKANDLPTTGELTLGEVVFAPGDIRVGTVTSEIGARLGTGAELFDVTSTSRVVEANLKLADQQLASLATPVTIHLPGGEEALGTIDAVGTPMEIDGSNGKKQTVIPIVISLDDPAQAGALQEATVSVDIPSERRDDVLSVPISALIAITPEQFGVEVLAPDGIATKVPVQTGLFAGGRVEISGAGLDSGQRVVVPQR